MDYIQQEKYNQKHALTLSFAMHALARGRSKFALQEMLSLIDKRPIEVLGIQHFFLKMRVLEATLEETNEKDLNNLLNDEQATKLAGSARQLLERTFDDALIREVVVQEFRQLSGVLKEFPQILKDIIEEATKKLACSCNLTRIEVGRIADILKLTKYSQKQSGNITQFVLQLVEEPDGQWNQQESFERLNCIAELFPQHSSDILPTLATGCSDEHSDVRRAAMKAISGVVAAAPQHASKVLTTLTKSRSDEDSDVRHQAVTAIGSVIAATPQHACGAPGHLRPLATRGGGPLTLGDAFDTTFAQRKSCRSRSWPPPTVEDVVCVSTHTASSAVSSFHAGALHPNLPAMRLRGSQCRSCRLGCRLLRWIAALRRCLRAKSQVRRRPLLEVARATVRDANSVRASSGDAVGGDWAFWLRRVGRRVCVVVAALSASLSRNCTLLLVDLSDVGMFLCVSCFLGARNGFL